MSEIEPCNASFGSQKRSRAQSAFKMFDPDSGKFSESEPAESKKTATDFAFINSAKPVNAASRDVRKAVRVHVMRKYHKSRRDSMAGIDRHKDQPASMNSCQDGASIKLVSSCLQSPAHRQSGAIEDRVLFVAENPHQIESQYRLRDSRNRRTGMKNLGSASHSLEVAHGHIQSPQRLLGGSIGPGPTLPCPGRPQMESASLVLLRFFLDAVIKPSIPMSPIAEHELFRDITTGSLAFRHGFLLVASAYHALWRDIPLPSACHHHSALTIRYINFNLESVDGQTEDGTLAAIAWLVAFENAVNPDTSSCVHLAGMEALINLRGVQRRGSAGYLPKLIEWVDLDHATSNLTKSRLSQHQPPAKELNATEEQEFLKNLDAQWTPDFPPGPLTVFEGMDNITARLFHRLRQLSTLANSMACSKNDPELQAKYTECIQLLERQMNASAWSMNLNNLRQHGSTTQQREPIAVRTCTRTLHCTTLIFIVMVLRKTTPSSQIVAKVARRSKFSLKILTHDELWVHFPPRFLLWTLIVTIIASAGHADRLWLMQTLKTLREKLALDSWKNAKAILVQYAWVDHLCTRPASLIWKELDSVEV